jgi:DNA-binding transcriptional LysR family regulator
LLAIVEHMGLRAAAEHLRTAQPNLSVQAKLFQETFGIQLFRKTKDRRIQLTETGIAFKAIAQGVLDTRDEAIAALIAIERGEIHALSLGCAPFVDPELFQAVCELHKEIVPGCPIRPTHGDAVQLVEELTSGEIDAAIMTLPITGPRLSVKAIHRDKLVACLRADHPLATKRRSTLRTCKTILQFYTTRNGIQKPMHSFWSGSERAEFRSKSSRALLTLSRYRPSSSRGMALP